MYLRERVALRVTWNYKEVMDKAMDAFLTSWLPLWIETHAKYLRDNGSNGHYVGDQVCYDEKEWTWMDSKSWLSSLNSFFHAHSVALPGRFADGQQSGPFCPDQGRRQDTGTGEEDGTRDLEGQGDGGSGATVARVASVGRVQGTCGHVGEDVRQHGNLRVKSVFLFLRARAEAGACPDLHITAKQHTNSKPKKKRKKKKRVKNPKVAHHGPIRSAHVV